MLKRSIIEYYSGNDGYKCGYCKKPDSNYSHGLWAHIMTVSDYQDLIDRGWRRSGKYCYKPFFEAICCPMFTIRCKALDFKPSKSQKKILKRFNKYLIGQDEVTSENIKSNSSENMALDDSHVREQLIEPFKHHQDINISDMDISFIEGAVHSENEEPSEVKLNEKLLTSEVTKQKVTGPDPAKPTCKKSKQIRKERMLEKCKKKGLDISTVNKTSKNQEKQIEDFINDLPNEIKRKLVIKLVRTEPPSAEWLASSKQSHEVYVKYQTIVHGDRPEKCTESKFHDFLVHSPLMEEYTKEGPPCGYGSFHQQYWIDGKLIAVGVLDILPKCVSSVYFFYDPEYRSLTLGTYGALREIAFARTLHTMCSDLKYYYMGYYIHSCHKMRYKGQFFPSDLLCPETFKWFPIKESIQKIEVIPNSRLNPDIDGIDENFPTDHDINCIPILHNKEMMTFKTFRKKFGRKPEGFEEVKEYAGLVGAKAAKRLVLVK